jgi:sec-independent protein translocase protein TatA
MPFRIGPTELVIVLVIVLVIFGAGKLSQVGGALGKGIREFRKASSGNEEGEPKKPSRNGVTPTTRA